MTSEVTESSPGLRQVNAAHTRRRVLDALRAEMLDNPAADVSFDRLAERSGVNRRTLFRHFASKEALLAAFWADTNARLGTRVWPDTPDDLVTMPPALFAALDRIAPIVDAAHAGGAARDMRLQARPERQARFRAALAPVTRGLPPDRAEDLTAVVQLLFSATAAMALRENWNLRGDRAGRAVAWAIAALLDAAAADRHQPGQKDASDG
jgi:AcrR family transcriptional regulator